jgi:hypothetical protein
MILMWAIADCAGALLIVPCAVALAIGLQARGGNPRSRSFLLVSLLALGLSEILMVGNLIHAAGSYALFIL